MELLQCPSNTTQIIKRICVVYVAGMRGPRCTWRKWVDLEHNVLYNTSIHWNALTDGAVKYIFHAHDGTEQLFDLAVDPGETRDLSGDVRYAALLRQWRSRLVDQFQRERRGSSWVRDGVLQTRPRGQLYSPHYPGPRLEPDQ